MKAIEVLDDGTWVDLPAGETGVLAIQGRRSSRGMSSAGSPTGSCSTASASCATDGSRPATSVPWTMTGSSRCGRAKDLIIRGGHNIDPAVIEALLSHPEASAANAVGRPDAHSGEVPVAYVTVAAGSTTSEEDRALGRRARAGGRCRAEARPSRRRTARHARRQAVQPALRADAAQREIADALADVDGVVEVVGAVDDGPVVPTVTVDGTADVRGSRRSSLGTAMRTAVHSTDRRTSEPAS